jgi:trk system potassium uptake protein TrkH
MPKPKRTFFRSFGTASRPGEAVRILAVLAGLAVTVADIGSREDHLLLAPAASRAALSLCLSLFIASFFIDLTVTKRIVGQSLAIVTRRRRLELTIAGLSLAFFWVPQVEHAGLAALSLILLLRTYLLISHLGIPPGMLFVGSFLVLIAAGAGALMLPSATPPGQPISIEDAAFTIISAISQTGLVVRDTGAGFTRFGQIIILIWIQVGALGVLVFGALLANLFGSGFSLRATQTLAEPTEQGWTGALSLSRLVIFIIFVTHAFEAIGAAAIFLGWPETWAGAPDMTTTGDRLFHSVFFSISAFCNAGFVTTSNSLQGLRGHWTSHLLIAPLIVLGSIGFPVLDNIWRVIWARIRGRRVHRGALVRLNLNSLIVLSTTLAVYVLGYSLIAIGEYTQTSEPTRLILLDAHFMTINRTSGFDTIPPQDMGLLSRLALILLMFIGGSPGSVAGGIKMMVFAVLALTVVATIRGRDVTEAFGRTLPNALVRKSAVLIVLSLLTVMTVTGVLAATETGRGGHFTLGHLIFEATSAFGTTGLSVGVTPETTTTGRIALMVAMFVGRVGPLAVLASLVAVGRRSRARYAYPTENVVVY